MLIVGLAVLWLVPLAVTAIFVVMVIREERAERREFEREIRAMWRRRTVGPVPIVLTDEHRDRPPNPVAPGQRFDPRVHGRADHLRI
jgi:hypothetical protein